MKSISYVIAIVLMSSLLMAPSKDIPFLTESNANNPPSEFYTVETNVIAVKYDAGSNVTECIVTRLKYLNYMNAEGMFNKCVDRNISFERPNQQPVRCRSLEAYGQKIIPHFYYTGGWHFQPIPGTNLWTVIEFLGFRPNSNDESFEFGIHGFNVHVFNEKKILSTKRLDPFSPPGCNGFAELRFDTAGRKLLYKTKDGYEIYDLLAGTVKPYDKPQPPPEWRVLLLTDFGCSWPEPHPEKFSQQ
jgi:hypothetical protein